MDARKLSEFIAAAIRASDRADVDLIASDIQRNVEEPRLLAPILPDPGQSVAIAPTRSMTAALIFDRVWLPPTGPKAPPEVVAYGGTEIEVWIQALTFYLHVFPDATSRFAGWLKQLDPDLHTVHYRRKEPWRRFCIANDASLQRRYTNQRAPATATTDPEATR